MKKVGLLTPARKPMVLNVTVSENDTVTLPFSAIGSYDCFVNFGDGGGTKKIISGTDPNISNQYLIAGDYEITISGHADLFKCSLDGNLNVFLTAIKHVGDIGSSELNFRDSVHLLTVEGFINSTNVDADDLFRDCVALKTVVGKFFRNDAVSSIARCFFGCISFENPPVDLFEGCTSVTVMADLLLGCVSITNLVSGLLDPCVNVTNLGRAFYGMTGLASVTPGLIDKLTLLTNVNSLFFGCNIEDLPVDFFRFNLLITDVSSMFKGCELLQPTYSYFSYIHGILTCDGLFRECKAMVYTPSGFYDTFTLCTNFGDLYRQCLLLASINVGQYDYCVSATDFSNAHSTNVSLSSIPNNLMVNCILVAKYDGMFVNTVGLSLPSVIFDLPSLSVVTSFSSFLEVSSTANSPTGAIQEIWNFATSATRVDALFNCESLSNYADAPDDWKGL